MQYLSNIFDVLLRSAILFLLVFAACGGFHDFRPHLSNAKRMTSHAIYALYLPKYPCMVYLATFTIKINQM